MTHSTLPDRLLACPFCGSEAVAENFVVEACVRCLSCKAQVVRQHGTYDDTGLPAAIAAWNRRKAAAALSGRDAVAIGWVFQHGETGRMTFCPNDGVNTPDVFAELNPGYTLCSAVFTTPQPGDGVVDGVECHGLDTPTRVCFYEQDFYVLSNFSAFRIEHFGLPFDTSEAAYHWFKFADTAPEVAEEIRLAPSAHEAFKIAERNKDRRRPDWDEIKLDVMRGVLRSKVSQHEYVRRKLLATGARELVENSWRDNVWGWGPNKDGENWLGRLWMEIRQQLRAAAPSAKGVA